MIVTARMGSEMEALEILAQRYALEKAKEMFKHTASTIPMGELNMAIAFAFAYKDGFLAATGDERKGEGA